MIYGLEAIKDNLDNLYNGVYERQPAPYKEGYLDGIDTAIKIIEEAENGERC